jgi:hypothetical protein
MDKTQADSECVLRANKAKQPKDHKLFEKWARAYQLSTQDSANKPSTFRRLMQKCGGTFQHAPLNRPHQSIRLIYLLPDLSPEGLIRCITFQASIENSYACLSYEWNRALHLRKDRDVGFEKRIILINERPLLILENLFDFLCTARYNATRSWRLDMIDLSTPLWIDAISIDQSNPSERNHQVKLMGDIYSKALTVHVWLGISIPPTEGTEVFGLPRLSAYEYTKQFEADMHNELAEVGKNMLPFGHSLNRYDVSYITQNTYWKRAWVVQEICLARRLIFWIHTVPVNETVMHNLPENYFAATSDDDLNQYLCTNFKKLARTSLLTTLHQFQNKRCADPRDRVFSLLSLCSTGALTIPVDYEVELDQLAYHVLRSHPGPICPCSAMFVARQLELSTIRNGFNEPTNIRGDNTAWIEVDMPELSLNQYLLDPQSIGPCASIQLIFRAVTRGYLTVVWNINEGGYRLHGGDKKIHTIRIALRALSKVDEFGSDIPLCQTAYSPIDHAGEATVRLGRGRDDSDLQYLFAFDWTPNLQENEER